MKLPEWLINTLLYTVSGFMIGFLNAFIATEGQQVDLRVALVASATLGIYQAAKELAKYMTTNPLTQTTAAGDGTMPTKAPEPHIIDRML